MVNSTKTITKAISNGKVEITKSDLGTDKASDWTVLEVVYGGNKIMAGVSSTDDKITVTLDDAGSAFTGDVVVTLTYEATMNISQDAQQPPVVKRGEIRGLVNAYQSPFVEGPIALWDCNLPDLEDGYWMFTNCGSLTSFSGDLPKLTYGQEMFHDCSSLTSFSGDLSSLTSCGSMFSGCSKLTSFSGDLPKLTYGDGMFAQCRSLTSFSGDLSALTVGRNMFTNCYNLTSFSGDLSALTDGVAMFYGCKLDQASVDHILATINDLKAKGYSGTIYLGVASGVDKRTSEFAAKGWTVN